MFSLHNYSCTQPPNNQTIIKRYLLNGETRFSLWEALHWDGSKKIVDSKWLLHFIIYYLKNLIPKEIVKKVIKVTKWIQMKTEII